MSNSLSCYQSQPSLRAAKTAKQSVLKSKIATPHKTGLAMTAREVDVRISSKINGWVFAFFLAVSGLSLLHAEEPLPGAVPSQEVVVSSTSEATTPGIDSAVREAQQEVRDPFSMDSGTGASTIAPGALAGSEITVELQGIGFGSKDAYAVIGGEVFYKGDEKMGIKLLEVRRREVDILAGGGKVTLPLFPDQDLKKARARAKAKGAIKKVSEDQPSETPSSLSRGERPPL